MNLPLHTHADAARRLADTSRAAARHLSGLLPPTPLRPALALDASGGLLLKMESFQPTGSFKVRGALSRIAALGGDGRRRGVVAASTGNHGAAVAHAAQHFGVPATVIVPEPTPEGRVRAIESRGATVLRVGDECAHSEAAARERVQSSGETFVSPYNDAGVMAGQGTLAVELLEQARTMGVRLGRVYVAVGGGGLIGGVAAVLQDADASIEVVGCSPAASCSMHASVAAGKVVETEHRPTLSLATAGGLEDGSVTLEPCQLFVDRWELMGEAPIAAALRRGLVEERLMMEGAAALALAGRLADGPPEPGRVDCVVVCGGNLDAADLMSVMAGGAEA